MKEFFKIRGLAFEDLREDVARIKSLGRIPFFHFTDRADAILNGPLIAEIMTDLYAMFDKELHEAYIVPYKYKERVQREIEGYGG